MHSGRRAALFGTGLRVGEVNQAVLNEARMQRDIEKAAQASGQHRRKRSDRCGVEHAVSNHAEPAGSLGDEHPAIGKKSNSPRMIQILRVQGDVNAAASGSQIPWTCTERVHRRRTSSTPSRTLRWLLRRAGRGGGESNESEQSDEPRCAERAHGASRERN
jgi:hypothetical protein